MARKHAGHAAEGRCRPLNVSWRAHVFDVAGKAWMLPLVSQLGAPDMAPLIEKMRAPNPEDRPSFDGALAMLDALEASREKLREDFAGATEYTRAALARYARNATCLFRRRH